MSCSLAARWLNASEPELKDQVSVPVVALEPMTGEGESVSIESSWASDDWMPAVVPDLLTEKTVGVTTFVMSMSVMVRVPVEARLVLVSVSDVASLLPASMEMVGVSLEPVMVTVTVDVVLSDCWPERSGELSWALMV